MSRSHARTPERDERWSNRGWLHQVEELVPVGFRAGAWPAPQCEHNHRARRRSTQAHVLKILLSNSWKLKQRFEFWCWSRTTSSGGWGHCHAGGGEINALLLQVRFGTMRPPACLILALLVCISRYSLVCIMHVIFSLFNAVVLYVSGANTIEKSIRWWEMRKSTQKYMGIPGWICGGIIWG